MVEEGPFRRWLDGQPIIPRKKILGETIGVKGVDSDIEHMKQEKEAEWRQKGYSENLISMAVKLADDWAWSMANAFAPPEAKEAVVKNIYPTALSVADRWIDKIGTAVMASKVV